MLELTTESIICILLPFLGFFHFFQLGKITKKLDRFFCPFKSHFNIPHLDFLLTLVLTIFLFITFTTIRRNSAFMGVPDSHELIALLIMFYVMPSYFYQISCNEFSIFIKIPLLLVLAFCCHFHFQNYEEIIFESRGDLHGTGLNSESLMLIYGNFVWALILFSNWIIKLFRREL